MSWNKQVFTTMEKKITIVTWQNTLLMGNTHEVFADITFRMIMLLVASFVIRVVPIH